MAEPIDISWSPDNRTLHFVIEKEGNYALWRQPLDATEPVLIADLGTEGIEYLRMSPDGKSYITIRGNWIHDAVLIAGLKE